MKIIEAARSGMGEILSHKMRSFLTFFAISIGTAAFMYTFSTITSSRAEMAKSLELSGPGRVSVEQDWGGTGSSILTYKDALSILAQLPDLYMFSPVAAASPKVLTGNLNENIDVAGILPEWRKRDWVALSIRGRFISEADVTANARVAVVLENGDWPEGRKKPWWMKEFPDDVGFARYAMHNNLLGEKLNLDGNIFTVVGVMKMPHRMDDPRWFRMTSDPAVLIPLTTALTVFPNDGKSLEYLTVDTGRENNTADTKRQIETILNARHAGKFKGWKVRSFSEMMAEELSRQNKMLVVIMLIGLISLVSGGIGIMNVTLAMVYSRIKEIGTRRALGATRGDITVQFVVEAVMLSLVGGVAGIVLGYGLILYMRADSTSTPQPLLWWIPFASLGVAAFAGFVFSIYPAYTASKLDPVESLRYE